MEISRDKAAEVAKLARLKLGEEELERLSLEMTELLAYFEQISSLSTDDVPPTAHAIGVTCPLRDDAATEGLTRETALREAPNSDGEHYVVPKVIDA